jgi:hydrogenase nickel incorporation protein HypA/HybF
MHELGMCEAVVAAVEARAQGRRVRRVRVRVGRLHRVEPGAFAQAFSLAAEGTVAEAAAAELVVLPVRTRCLSCGALSEGDDRQGTCGSCGHPALEVLGGDELVLESLEYEPGDAVGPGLGRTRGAEPCA